MHKCMQTSTESNALSQCIISPKTSMCKAMGMEVDHGLSYAVEDAECNPLQCHVINKVKNTEALQHWQLCLSIKKVMKAHWVVIE